MNYKLTLLFLFGLLQFQGIAQENTLLDQYISEALESNISLQQKELSYEKSLAVLKEAKANFLPSLSFEARFSVANGGRTIDFPVGDLMNPVYQNLNLINQRNQQSQADYPTLPAYPTIENEEINFLRPTEHDTKLRLVFPVYNTAILQNQRIRQNMVEVEKVSVHTYKKELAKEVKVAYFNFQKAQQAILLFEKTLELVEENLRTTQSLHRNHKVTKDAVFSAETDLQEVRQQMNKAKQDQAMAKAYFNFLLNRDYEAEIETSALSDHPVVLPELESFRQRAIQQRGEITQFNHFLAISDNQIDLNKGSNRPTVNLVGDYGFQGTTYAFGRDDDYAMGSLVLSWNLFNRSNKAKTQQAEISKREILNQKSEAQQQISLQVINAWHQAQTAFQQIELSDSAIKSTQSAYQLVEKKYRQGQANLIELTNARTQLTNAQLKKIIAQFDLQSKQAELEYAGGF